MEEVTIFSTRFTTPRGRSRRNDGSWKPTTNEQSVCTESFTVLQHLFSHTYPVHGFEEQPVVGNHHCSSHSAGERTEVSDVLCCRDNVKKKKQIQQLVLLFIYYTPVCYTAQKSKYLVETLVLIFDLDLRAWMVQCWSRFISSSIKLSYEDQKLQAR